MIFWLLPLLILVAFWLAFTLARAPLPRVRLLHATLHACGCLWVEGVLACPCAVHDPAEPPVEQWAAEIGDM